MLGCTVNCFIEDSVKLQCIDLGYCMQNIQIFNNTLALVDLKTF